MCLVYTESPLLLFERGQGKNRSWPAPSFLRLNPSLWSYKTKRILPLLPPFNKHTGAHTRKKLLGKRREPTAHTQTYFHAAPLHTFLRRETRRKMALFREDDGKLNYGEIGVCIKNPKNRCMASSSFQHCTHGIKKNLDMAEQAIFIQY